MSGYLDHYGEGEEQRAKRARWWIGLIVGAVLFFAGFRGAFLFDNALGLVSYFHTLKHKAQVTRFVELLQKHDYDGAYHLWGCTETKPCPDYPYNKFMEDWGPKSANGQIQSFKIGKTRTCGSGAIVRVELGQNREERLWVESSEMTIGFSPWSVCPAR